MHFPCLQVSLIGLSDADIAIFGGDLNAAPIENQHHPYGMMRSVMKDSLTEKFPSASLHPAFATFGNADNTYTHNSFIVWRLTLTKGTSLVNMHQNLVSCQTHATIMQ